MQAAGVASKAKNSDDAVAKYTAAVAQYDEGLAADPEQPAILTNKAVALKGRGVERYNAAVRLTDDAAKSAALQAAKDDFKAAAETSSKAVTLIKAQPAPTDQAEITRYNGNKYAAMITRAESMRLYVSKADGTQADAGLEAYKDYIAVETDPAKKTKAQLDMAQMLLDGGASDKALAEFKAVASAESLAPGELLGAEVEIDGQKMPLVLMKKGGSVVALGATCSHWGGPLAEGKIVNDDCVECPWHGSQFSFQDGSVVQGPATAPQPVFEARVRNGQIEVRQRS